MAGIWPRPLMSRPFLSFRFRCRVRLVACGCSSLLTNEELEKLEAIVSLSAVEESVCNDDGGTPPTIPDTSRFMAVVGSKGTLGLRTKTPLGCGYEYSYIVPISSPPDGEKGAGSAAPSLKLTARVNSDDAARRAEASSSESIIFSSSQLYCMLTYIK